MRRNNEKGLSGGVSKGPPPEKALIHKVLKKEDAHIEKLELNLTSRESKTYNLPEKSSSVYDKLSENEKIIFLSGVFDGEGSFGSLL